MYLHIASDNVPHGRMDEAKSFTVERGRDDRRAVRQRPNAIRPGYGLDAWDQRHEA